MDLAGLARNMVSNGKLRSARDHTPITNHYRLTPNTYRHEANRLCRTLPHRDHRIVRHNQLAVQDIPIRSARHRVADPHAVPTDPHLGHMTHNGPKHTAKRQFGKEKS